MAEFPALLLLGFVVGALIGGIGGGGGIIAVPLFVLLLDAPPSDASSYSLVAVAAAGIIAVIIGAFANEVSWPWALVFGAIGILGSFLGAGVAANVDERVILVAFAVVVVLATARFLWGLREKPAVENGSPRRGAALASALGIGGVTGLVGVGGGFLIAPTLMRIVRLTPRVAVATSSAVILFNALSSISARFVVGFEIEWGVFVPLLIGAAVGAATGKLLAARASGWALQYASGALLVISCVAVGVTLFFPTWIS